MLILAADLRQTCLLRYGLDGKTLAVCKGSALEGIPLSHPFNGLRVPIICGEHVTLEAGTGLVHTAPAHGLDDYFIGQKYGLSTDSPVDAAGNFSAATPGVSG